MWLITTLPWGNKHSGLELDKVGTVCTKWRGCYFWGSLAWSQNCSSGARWHWLLTKCISATGTCVKLCLLRKSLCVTSHLFPLARKHMEPAPIDRPSAMLPSAAFLFQACLWAPFSPSSFYLGTSIFSFCSAPDFPSYLLLQSTMSPASFQPCPSFYHPSSSVFPSWEAAQAVHLLTKGEEQELRRGTIWSMGSRTWCSRAPLAPSSDGEDCQSYCCVAMAKVGVTRQGMGWGGMDLKLQLPLCVFTSSSLSVPFGIYDPPPCQELLCFKPQSAFQRVTDQLACSLTTLKGLMSKAKFSPSNSFRKTDYLSFTSGKTVSIHSKSPWWSWAMDTAHDLYAILRLLTISFPFSLPMLTGHLPSLGRIRRLTLVIWRGREQIKQRRMGANVEVRQKTPISAAGVAI